MANPQRENGHIDIANEIADHLAKIRIPGQEMQILWVIFRKTWGWQKKMDTISHTQFAKATGIERRHIGGLLENLLKKRIITKKRDSYICKYGIQKDWEKWKLSLKRVTITKKRDTPITKKSDETITKKSDHNRKKENYTKEINIQNEHPSEPKNQEQEIDNLITLYKEKFPAHIKRFGLSAIMKMRDTIDSAVMEGAKLEDIAKRISTAKDGTPWKIISENWLSKYKKEKKNYDKLIKRFSN